MSQPATTHPLTTHPLTAALNRSSIAVLSLPHRLRTTDASWRIAWAAAPLVLLAGLLSGLASAAPQRGVPLAHRANTLLQARCLQCHGGDGKGGLDLRTRAAALKGGSLGPALV